MINKYSITGMTCGSCVSKVQQAFNNFDDILTSEVQLEYPQATISSTKNLDLIIINKTLSSIGDYKISNEQIQQKTVPLPKIKKAIDLSERNIYTYKPLILIVAFISGVSLLGQYPFSNFSGMLWMRHFMAGFFIVFAFFKLLNLKGFTESYRMYDVIAANWKPWAYIYPFLELLLGLLYFINLYSLETNITTTILLSVSSIGVIKSNMNNKKIKCACLGDVFNLPMSTVTIIENLSMIVMSILMIILTIK